jgi:hypothetical protein
MDQADVAVYYARPGDAREGLAVSGLTGLEKAKGEYGRSPAAHPRTRTYPVAARPHRWYI